MFTPSTPPHDFVPHVHISQDDNSLLDRNMQLLISSLTSTPRQTLNNSKLNQLCITPGIGSDVENFSSLETTPSLSPSSSVIFTELEPEQPLLSEVQVTCMARARIPTPHGPAFLHLYHNTQDNKEHLAIVVDPAQLSADDNGSLVPHIRSATLEKEWEKGETNMDRITRGAYMGRLSSESALPSKPTENGVARGDTRTRAIHVPAPLVRIHSECFTGETIGSLRCDCGEQLDEAIRRISKPITIRVNTDSSEPEIRTVPGRGVVVYMRQEGRGIGLLSKLRAYNLQDIGYDTVAANLMLGHDADERGYEIAGAILKDLGLDGNGFDQGIRLLTNNPDKVSALEQEGVRIVERVPMIPRTWRCQTEGVNHSRAGGRDVQRIHGATMIGGNETFGEDLDKYLRTKVLRMGHMLSLPA